jgi:hypothetical protein
MNKKYIIVDTNLFNQWYEEFNVINTNPNLDVLFMMVPAKYKGLDMQLFLSAANPYYLGRWSWDGDGHKAFTIRQYKELVDGGFSKQDVDELYPVRYLL